MITGIPGKTGIVYTLDRQTGEFLWARPTVMQNVDQQHRRRHRRGHRESRGALHARWTKTKLICPGSNGGKNWPAGAYSPHDQRDVHAAAEHVHERHDDDRHARSVEGLRPRHAGRCIAPGTDKVGTVWAISAETGQTLWKYEQRAGMLSLVATGGGLVFGGDANGRFRAFDDTTGKVLWEMNLGSPVSGYPDHVRGRRQAVRRGHDRAVARRGIR